jgi:membrane fusion protein (multidrug efflux system)
MAVAEQARAEVKAAEAAEAVARLNVQRSHVKAPFNSAIAERLSSAGDFLRVGSPLYRIVNDLELRYIVQVPERYANVVQTNQPVIFSVDAYPAEQFKGFVYLISPQVDMVTRTFSLGALVRNQDRKLKANSFARGELVLSRSISIPTIPVEAVVNFAGVTKVFVVEDGVARSRTVELGRVRNGRHEVRAGLKGGEALVVSGQTKLVDGAKVRVTQGTTSPQMTSSVPGADDQPLSPN